MYSMTCQMRRQHTHLSQSSFQKAASDTCIQSTPLMPLMIHAYRPVQLTLTDVASAQTFAMP